MHPGRVSAWSLVLLLCLGGRALAQAPVSLEVSLGFQGTLRLGKWHLLTVQVHNPGPAITAILEARTWLGSEARGDFHSMAFTRPLDLPSGARKRVSFTVPITSIADPLVVSLRSGERLLAEQRLNVQAALPAEQVIVGLTRDVSLDFLATVFPKTATRVVYLSPADAPSQWSAYDSISAIVVKGVSLQALSAAQYDALLAWLSNGGTLVVSADAQYTLLTEPRMRAVLPVSVTGLQHVEGSSILADAYATPFPDVPLAQAQAQLTTGQVLLGSADAPLLAQRRLGKGRVVFLGLDYAVPRFAAWPGYAALWRDMLKTPEQVDFARLLGELGMLDESHPIVKLLVGRPILRFPSHLTLTGSLSVYGLLLALLFWLLSRRPAHAWRYWGGVAVVISAVSVYAAGPWLASGLQHDALFFDATTMEIPPEADHAAVHGALGVFSVRGGQFTLPLQQPDTMLRHTFTRGVGRAGKALEANLASGFTVQRLDLAPWALRLFSTESMTPTPLRISVQPRPTGFHLQVTNRGSLPLQSALVIAQGRVFSLGTIAPGEAMSDELYPTLHSTTSAQELTWRVLFKHRPAETPARLVYLQEALLQHYFGDKRLAEASATPLLAGWLLAPTTLAPPVPRGPVQGATLVVSRLGL